jgi:hypothetical protein
MRTRLLHALAAWALCLGLLAHAQTIQPVQGSGQVVVELPPPTLVAPPVVTYTSVPGGVTLEGAAYLGSVKSVTYEKEANRFVLDDGSSFNCPIETKALREMALALAQDDLLGVSLSLQQNHVFGGIRESGRVATDLFDTDRFLANIVWGENWKGQNLAGGYKPVTVGGLEHALAVHFNFRGFNVSKNGMVYQPMGGHLHLVVLPIIPGAAPNGGDMVDPNPEGKVPNSVQRNADHIRSNLGHYQTVEPVAAAMRYGYAACFLRGLRNAGINLNDVAAQIK